MGHNVQITYILRGIRDIEGRVLREEMVDAVGPIRRAQGRPRKRPKKLHAYLRPAPPRPYYEATKCRKALRRRGIKSKIARKGKERGEKLGQHR
jgi:hypothetical protein